MMNITIAQRYSVEKELGAGGMGTVYRGIDTHTQQTVAIKHLKPHMAQPDMLERFRREGEALRDLNHPNIVKMLAALEDDGNHYLIMEYVSGGDLAHLLEKGKLPLEKVLALAIDLADALTRAHKLNIVHRDLKPANVLIGDDGVLRLTDFGVAHVGSQQRVTDTDAIVGTIDYLPPEAFSGGTIDARADIWAFGVMLFEMLSHEKPFAKNTVMETVYAITTQPLPDLETLCPDAPVALIDLIYRMLERDPLARIASVRHVGAALEDVLHGRDTAVPSPRFETPLPEIFSLPKHNLPAQTTPFVGREAELTEIARLLADPTVRLITIVAPGGMGKTRLSLVAGEHEQEHFAQGVFFVELAPLSDLNSMISAIAEATGYQFQADGRDTQQQVLDFLSQKQVLLILDNYEHLIAAAGLTTDILKAAPQVKLIATSRQRLNQTGETIFNLEGMDFPAWETPADALEYAAVKLFMQSAKRVQPQFELTAANMNSVARICKQVQGMPLGIVLAAAWLSMLSPEEIAAEIAQSFDFLESETGDLPERQRSMRAVFEYSWNLMSDTEKDVFAKLSVFRGGFTREAAEAVAGANLRLLMALVNKSLLRRDAESGRYKIHELLRQYGEEKLQELPAEYESAHESHSIFFANFSAKNADNIRGTHEQEAFTENDIDLENILLAWEWSRTHHHWERTWQFLFNLHWYFYWRKQLNQLALICEQAIAALDTAHLDIEDKEILVALYAYHSTAFGFQGLIELSKESCQKSLMLFHQLPHPPLHRETLYALTGLSAMLQEDLSESLKLLEDVITGCQTHNYLWEVGFAFAFRVSVIPLYFYDKYDYLIKQSLNNVLEIAKKIQNPHLELMYKLYSSNLAFHQGRFIEVKSLLIDIQGTILDINSRIDTEGMLAQSLIELGEYQAAKQCYYEMLIYCQKFNSHNGIVRVFNYIYAYFLKMHQEIRAFELAALVFDKTEILWLKENAHKQIKMLKSQFSPEVFGMAIERGKSLDLDTVVQDLLAEFAADDGM